MTPPTAMPTAASPVTTASLKQAILRYARYSLAKEWNTLDLRERFLATSLAVRDTIIDAMLHTEQRMKRYGAKRIYYLSMEFLAGRALTNNLINLGIYEPCAAALGELGADIYELAELEPDPALGNGGLGRLAACFLDSMATLGLVAYGYGINYEFGLFRQVFRDGYQEEVPDVWRSPGTPWLIVRPDKQRKVRVYGQAPRRSEKMKQKAGSWTGWRELIGLPSDLPVVGFGGRTVNYLRLYSAQTSEAFDVDIFHRGDYVRAIEEKIRSERISKVLYPSDDIPAGRELRLLQEYFFVACALQDIIERHGGTRDDLLALPERVAIQLNDTHPALAVAELLRILLDDWAVPWDDALRITRGTIAYTNHTLLPEAQEKWPVALLEKVVPRHLQIIYDLNEDFLKQVERTFPGDTERRRDLSLIDENHERCVRMMHLSIVGSHSVNGVSELHSRLLKSALVPGFAALWPDKFNNKTNGVTQRRWLLTANQPLAALIKRELGDHWIINLDALRALEEKCEDQQFRADFAQVKQRHKENLVGHIRRSTGVAADPRSLFDVQVKRIHEYKRQLMNAFRIAHEYLVLIEDGVAPLVPRTYIFAGKAAPSYAAAKRIIKLIHCLAAVVNADPRTRDWMRIAFIPDYRVTLAERIIPAANVSEQISTSGKEASGTGNMKFMMNGALTVGTLDGANIEMLAEAGAENMFIFGLTAEEIAARDARGVRPAEASEQDARVARVLQAVRANRFCPRQPGLFTDLVDGLLQRDPFFVLADLGAFIDVQERVGRAFLDQDGWTKKSILNVARSGKFSSDRTIREYARDVWGVR